MIYLISDTHFNHANIIKYCKRPFSNIENMNKVIIQNWNDIVKENDVVFHLGDLGLGKREEVFNLVKNLNGKKYLLKGNHDKWCDSTYSDLGFQVIENPYILKEYKIILSHIPIPDCNIPHGFINVHGHIHNNKLYECIENYDPKEFSLNIHVNVSCEKINYSPINILEINNFFE